MRGGFVIAEVHLTAQPLLDPIDLAARAQTVIRGKRFHIYLRADMDESELSISLYHEVLEAATVAADVPPEVVIDFNEGDFERAAQAAHVRLGIASPGRLNQMLAEFWVFAVILRYETRHRIAFAQLADGARVLRVSESRSGLCLEKRLDPAESVVKQKERWKQVFVAMLDRELGATG